MGGTRTTFRLLCLLMATLEPFQQLRICSKRLEPGPKRRSSPDGPLALHPSFPTEDTSPMHSVMLSVFQVCAGDQPTDYFLFADHPPGTCDARPIDLSLSATACCHH